MGEIGKIRAAKVEAEIGPKLADAARDAVGVIVEHGGVFDGFGMLGSSCFEPFEIEHLSGNDGVDDVADELGLGDGGLSERVENLLSTREELGLAGGFALGECGVPSGRVASLLDRVLKFTQGVHFRVDRNVWGIGEGVAGAREEVGEGDWFAEIFGEESDGEEKRARNITQ